MLSVQAGQIMNLPIPCPCCSVFVQAQHGIAISADKPEAIGWLAQDIILPALKQPFFCYWKSLKERRLRTTTVPRCVQEAIHASPFSPPEDRVGQKVGNKSVNEHLWRALGQLLHVRKS